MRIVLEPGKKYMTDKGHEVTIEKVTADCAIGRFVDEDGDPCLIEFTHAGIGYWQRKTKERRKLANLELEASILTDMLVDARTKIVELEVELETLKNAKR